MTHRLRSRAGIVAAVWLYLGLGVLWTRAVPPWEAPDEPWHLAYAEALASGRMPTPDDTYESHQPPLYYAWPAWALRTLDRGVIPRGPDNPRYPLAVAAYLHPPGDPAAPRLALVRAFGGLLGALTIVLAWATARVVARAVRPAAAGRVPAGSRAEVRAGPADRRGATIDSTAAAAALLAGLWPQFTFIAHAVSNDGLAAACGALATYGCARIAAHGARDRRGLAAASAGVALGWWVKLNVLPLVVVAVAAVVARAGLDARAGRLPPRRAAREAAAAAAVVVGVHATAVAGLAAALPAASGAVFGQLVGRGWAMRPGGVDGTELAGHVARLAASFVARFGWLNLDVPMLFHLVATGVVLVGWAGLWAAARRWPAPARLAAAVLALGVASVFAAAVRNLLSDPQPQGRFLFPALAAWAVLLALGWSASLPARWRRAWPALSAAGLVAAHVWITQTLLPGAYRDAAIAPPRVETRMMALPPAVAARLTAGAVARQTFHVAAPDLRRVEFAVSQVEGEVGTLDASVRGPSGALLGRASSPLAALGPNAWVVVDVGGAAAGAWGEEASAEDVPSAAPGRATGGGAHALEISLSPDAGAVWLWGAPDGDLYPAGELTVDGRLETDLIFLTVLSERRGRPAGIGH